MQHYDRKDILNYVYVEINIIVEIIQSDRRIDIALINNFFLVSYTNTIQI